MKRESGDYWVQFEGEWYVAEYISSPKESIWYLTSSDIALCEDEFSEIDERQIIRQS